MLSLAIKLLIIALPLGAIALIVRQAIHPRCKKRWPPEPAHDPYNYGGLGSSQAFAEYMMENWERHTPPEFL